MAKGISLKYQDWFYHTWHLNEFGNVPIKDCKVCEWGNNLNQNLVSYELKQQHGKLISQKEMVKKEPRKNVRSKAATGI